MAGASNDVAMPAAGGGGAANLIAAMKDAVENGGCENLANDCPALGRNVNVLIPTVSQWGLILFGLLLLSATLLAIRRRGSPTPVTTSLLVLMAAGVVAVGASYAEFESSRSDGGTDVAVEFVNDLLGG